MPTSERADLKRLGFDGKCTARSQRTGEPCRRPAARGANVCPTHGGSAPQVKAAAQRRLAQAADVLVQRLLGFALDGEAPDHVALQAIRDALDRAGLGAKQAFEVGVTQPWEQVMENITGIANITRAESRAARGLAVDVPSLAPAPALADAIDAEVVEYADQEPSPYPPSADAASRTGADTPDVPDPPAAAATPPAAQSPGLQPMEQATRELRTRPLRRRR